MMHGVHIDASDRQSWKEGKKQFPIVFSHSVDDHEAKKKGERKSSKERKAKPTKREERGDKIIQNHANRLPIDWPFLFLFLLFH